WESRIAIWSCLVLLTITLMGERASWIHERNPVLAVLIAAAAILLPFAMNLIEASGTYAAAAAGLVIVAAALARFSSRYWTSLRAGLATQASTVFAVGVVGAIFLAATMESFRYTMLATRDFYGMFRVETNSSLNPGRYRFYELRSGSISHGLQFRDPNL